MSQETETFDMLQLTCDISDNRVGLPVSRIQEILDTRQVRRLPHTPDYLIGYTDLRGESILVADPGIMLGLGSSEATKDTRIVVLEVATDTGARKVGLRMDRVHEVSQMDDAPLTSFAGSSLLAWDSRMVRGIAKCRGEDVVLLEIDELMSTKVLESHPSNAATDLETA